MTQANGILFFVTGASGVGKDTLMALARERLPESRYAYARRAITRPADAGGEAHRAVTVEQFLAEQTQGAFLLSWQAHGLHYGLPRELRDELAQGRCVIANGSRQAVGALLVELPDAVIVEITARPETIRARLLTRGREAGEAVAERLARQVAPYPSGAEVLQVANDGTPEEGAEAFARRIEARAARR